jgi:hypothetical protein
VKFRRRYIHTEVIVPRNGAEAESGFKCGMVGIV